MRFHWKYMALLAIILGVFLQTTARAVPKPGGIQPPDPIKPNPKPEPKPENSFCKRTDGSQPCTTLDDPTYCTAAGMTIPHEKEAGDKMVRGRVHWKPPAGLTVNNPQAFRRSLLSLTEQVYKGPQVKDIVIDRRGYNLVAALYVPERGVYLSTIPRGKAADDIIDDWKTMAPRLYAETRGLRVSPTKDPTDPQRLHAEDGVIYQYEKSVSHRKPEGHQLPEGSGMFVYGKRGGFDEQPGEVSPCLPGGKRQRACDVVLWDLGFNTKW
ncbi:hypothetical protein BJY01DRAFT_256463 [Aspergillus pseudoustus]|uniref:Uncharacterized protein n=1 Tax=Aspergillus pseudoustus TaxID=1810923 RepID=A0ABR4I9X1_9EURO